MKKYKNIDEYISNFPEDIQHILQKIRKQIKDLVPDSVETISYGIPTFKLNGKNLVHFAAFKSHVGFYPGSEAIEVFKDKLNDYKTSKGTIQFDFLRKIPFDLIQEIVKFRIQKLT